MDSKFDVINDDQWTVYLRETSPKVLYEVRSDGLTRNANLYVLSDGIIHWEKQGIINPTIIWAQRPYEEISRIEVDSSSIRIIHGGTYVYPSPNKLEKADIHKFVQTIRALKESGKIPNDLVFVDLMDTNTNRSSGAINNILKAILAGGQYLCNFAAVALTIYLLLRWSAQREIDPMFNAFNPWWPGLALLIIGAVFGFARKRL